MAKIIFLVICAILLQCVHCKYTGRQDYGELADEYDDNDYEEEEVGEVKRKAPNKTIRNYASHYKGSHEGNARETSGHTRGGYGHTRNTLKENRSPVIATTTKVPQTSNRQKGGRKHANGNGRKTRKYIKGIKPKGKGIKTAKLKGGKRAKNPSVDSQGSRRDGPLLAKWRRENFPWTAPVPIPRMAPVPDTLHGTALGSPGGHQGKRQIYDNLADEYDDDYSDEEEGGGVERDVHHRTARKDDPDDDGDDDDDDDDYYDDDDEDDDEEGKSTSKGGHGQIGKTQQESSSTPLPTKQTGIVTTTQKLGKWHPTLNTQMPVKEKSQRTHGHGKGGKKQKGKGSKIHKGEGRKKLKDKSGQKSKGKGGKLAKNHFATPMNSVHKAPTHSGVANKGSVAQGTSISHSAKGKFVTPVYTVPNALSDTGFASKDIPVEGNPTGSVSNSHIAEGNSVIPTYIVPKDPTHNIIGLASKYLPVQGNPTGSTSNNINTQGNYVNPAYPLPKDPTSTGFSSNGLLSVHEHPTGSSSYNNVAQGISDTPPYPLPKAPTNTGFASNGLKTPIYTVPKVPFDTGFANNGLRVQGNPTESASNSHTAQGNVEAPIYIVHKVSSETAVTSNDISVPGNPTGLASNSHIARGSFEAPIYTVPKIAPGILKGSQGKRHPHHRTVRKKEIPKHLGGDMRHHGTSTRSSKVMASRPPLIGGDRKNLLRILSSVDIIRQQLEEMDTAKRLRANGADKDTTKTEERSEEITPASKGLESSIAPSDTSFNTAQAVTLQPGQMTAHPSPEPDVAESSTMPITSQPSSSESSVAESSKMPITSQPSSSESSVAESSTMPITSQPSSSEPSVAQSSISPSSMNQPSSEQSTTSQPSSSLPIPSLSSVLQPSTSQSSGTTPCSKSLRIPVPCSKTANTVAPTQHDSGHDSTRRNMPHRSLYTGFSPDPPAEADTQFDYDEELIEQAASLQKRSVHNPRHPAMVPMPAGAMNTLHLCLSKTYNGATSMPLKKTDLTDTVQGIKAIEKSLRLVTHRLEKGFTTLMDQMTDFSNIQRTDIKANGDKIFTLKNSVANSFDDLKANISKISETHANISNIFEDSLSKLINKSESANISTAKTTSVVTSTTAQPHLPNMKLKKVFSGLKHKPARQLNPKTKGNDAVKSNAHASNPADLPNTKDKVLDELMRDKKRRSKKTKNHSSAFHNDHSFLEKFKSNPEIHEAHAGHSGHGSHSSHVRRTLPVGLFRKILRNAARERGKSLVVKRHRDRKSNKKRPRHLSRHGSKHSRRRNNDNIF